MPDFLHIVAELAPGKRVTVIAGGKSYTLPIVPEPAPVEPPNPLEVMSRQLLDRDAETRATIAAFAQRVDESVRAVEAAVGEVAIGQAHVVQSVNENTAMLLLPVKPVYGKDGKLSHAQRVKKAGG